MEIVVLGGHSLTSYDLVHYESDGVSKSDLSSLTICLCTPISLSPVLGLSDTDALLLGDDVTGDAGNYSKS